LQTKDLLNLLRVWTAF